MEPAATDPAVASRLGEVGQVVDGAEMACGSGLLLLITRAMRRLDDGGRLAVRSTEASVATDLPQWADLVGHTIVAEVAESATGPWWFAVQKSATTDTVFSTSPSTPVGQRLWAYTNFHCNLACSYCCAASSPKADPRRMSPELARSIFAEFREAGGAEVFLTGGEPFMHPELDVIVDAADGLKRTILTNGMVFGRGRRREILDAMDREVVLQISLDSATAERHDRERGAGSWDKAVSGIELAGQLGFRVRVAATLFDEDIAGVAELHMRLDDAGIANEDRVIRPVAHEGFADAGVHVSLSTLEPEPTVTADGAWWHPVAVTNPAMKIADAPLPLSEVFGVVRDTVAAQDAAARSGREVFRCA